MILFCGVYCFMDKKVFIFFYQLFSFFFWDVFMELGLFFEIFVINYFVLVIMKNNLISYLFELCEFYFSDIIFFSSGINIVIQIINCQKYRMF